MPPPLQYHAAETIYELKLTFRRPAMLIVGIPFVLMGLAILLATLAGAFASGVTPLPFATIAFGAAFALFGGIPIYIYIFNPAPLVRFTTEGVYLPKLRPWNKVGRVGGRRSGTGVEPELTLDSNTKVFGHAYSTYYLFIGRPMTEAEFTDFMDRLAAASASFPHVWLDRDPETRRGRQDYVSQRVIDELQRRARIDGR